MDLTDLFSETVKRRKNQFLFA